MMKKYYGIFEEKTKDAQGNTVVREYVEDAEGKYPLEAKIALEETARMTGFKLKHVYAYKN